MFLSRAAKRACRLDSTLLPPTFLLPFTANLSSVSHTTDTSTPSPLLHSTLNSSTPEQTTTKIDTSTSTPASSPIPAPSASAPAAPLSDSIRQLLPVLRAQGPHYITAHIFSRPYLLTEGDTLRLPFLMQNVLPGDVLRLTLASTLGSRDLTLKSGVSSPLPSSPTTSATLTTEPTTNSALSPQSFQMPEEGHFIPHMAKNKHRYLDDRLFVCRATVLGTEAEPLRIKEKTKRRQRRTKTVKSKHRFTVLKIKELRIRGLDEIEAGLDD